MNRILFAFTLVLISFYVNAQRLVSEATFSYDVSVKKMENGKESRLIQNATYKLFIKGSLSRSDFSNKMGVESTIYNSKTEKGVILKAYSAQQLMINLTKEDWLNHNQNFRSLTFKLENEQKNINGFLCKMATANLNNNESIVVYYDPEIQLNNKDFTISFLNIPGLPIQFQRSNSGMIFEYTLSGINYDAVSSLLFEYPKSGFRVLSYKEAQGLKKEN